MSDTAKQRHLERAQHAKDDEFYTRPEDIAAEFENYEGLFAGKRVLCNCDDPDRSSFYAHFRDRFHDLGLAQLTATGLGVLEGNEGNPVCATFDGTTRTDRVLDSGSFASPDCVAIAREHDIVVSNPPFSMIRGYLRVLLDVGVQFSFIGPLTAIGYRDYVRALVRGQLHMGATSRSMTFDRPGEEPKPVFSCWYSNMPHSVVQPRFEGTAKYCPDRHRPLANYDAVNVDRSSDIPMDYDGLIAVPVSFFPKMNTEQFQLVSVAFDPYIVEPDGSERQLFVRILIRNRAFAERPPEGLLI